MWIAARLRLGWFHERQVWMTIEQFALCASTEEFTAIDSWSVTRLELRFDANGLVEAVDQVVVSE